MPVTLDMTDEFGLPTQEADITDELKPNNDVVHVLKCFFDVELSDIFVPSHLLYSNKENSQPLIFNRSEFHTLKKDLQVIRGFSTYNNDEQDAAQFSTNNTVEQDAVGFSTYNNDEQDAPGFSCYDNGEQDAAGFSIYNNDKLDAVGFSSDNNDEEDDEIFISDSDNDFLNSDVTTYPDENSFLSNNLSNPPRNDALLPDDVDSQKLEYAKVPINVQKEASPNAKPDGVKNLHVPLSKLDAQNPTDFISVPETSKKQDKYPNAEFNINCSQAPVSQSGVQNFDLLQNLEGGKDVGFGALQFDKNALCNGFNIEPSESKSVGQSSSSNSHASLTELLDPTPDISLTDFPFSYKKKDLAEIELESAKERRLRDRSKKKKKKLARYIEIDDSGAQKEGKMAVDETLADERFRSFVQSINNNRNNPHRGYSSIHNPSEFPDLDKKKGDIKFVKSHKPSGNPPPVQMSHVSKCPEEEGEESSVSEAEEERDAGSTKEEKGTDQIKVLTRIVIENIPKHVSQDEIKNLLESFEGMKHFTCTMAGNFQRVLIEVDADNEAIDWAIECLNGSDPFGNSSILVKCYKL